MANTPKVYVICDNNCKYEGMTREQILAAIAQAIVSGTVGDCDTGFITTIKTINGHGLKFFVGTQAEYNELSEEAKKDLFAIITNDTTKEGLFNALAELQTDYGEFKKYLTELTNIGNPTHISMVYKSLGMVVDTSCTTEEFLLNLPLNSSVAFTVNTNDQPVTLTDFPIKNESGNSYGFVTLYKGWTNNYCYGIAWDIDGGIYFYKYHTDTGGTHNRNNGWHKIYTAADGSVPLADKATNADNAELAVHANIADEATLATRAQKLNVEYFHTYDLRITLYDYNNLSTEIGTLSIAFSFVSGNKSPLTQAKINAILHPTGTHSTSWARARLGGKDVVYMTGHGTHPSNSAYKAIDIMTDAFKSCAYKSITIYSNVTELYNSYET